MTSTHTDIPAHPTRDEFADAYERLIDNFNSLNVADIHYITVMGNFTADLVERHEHLRSELQRIAAAEPSQRASIKRALDWKPEGEG